MGRYVTPRGVEVEVGDDAARAVGYKPVELAEEKPKPPKKAPAKKSAPSKSEK
jgi:hypothetical protein